MVALDFKAPHSTDGIGVKRWTFGLDNHTIFVYDRPKTYTNGFKYRVDVFNIHGRLCATRQMHQKGQVRAQLQIFMEEFK